MNHKLLLDIFNRKVAIVAHIDKDTEERAMLYRVFDLISSEPDISELLKSDIYFFYNNEKDRWGGTKFTTGFKYVTLEQIFSNKPIMSHFLVKRITKFFDGHGSPDAGGESKFISTNDWWEVVPPDYYFREDLESYIDTPEEETVEDFVKFLDEFRVKGHNLRAEDAYNCDVHCYEVRRITETLAKSYEKTIKEYNKIT